MSSVCGCQHRHSDCGAPGTVPLCQLRRRDTGRQLVSPVQANPRLPQGKSDPASFLSGFFNRRTGTNPFDVAPKGPPPVKEKKDSFMSIGFGRPGSADGVTKFATTSKLKPSSIGQGGPSLAAAAASASPIGESVFRVLGRAAAGGAGPPAIGGSDEGLSSASPLSSSTESLLAETAATAPIETTHVGHTTPSSASRYLLVLGDDPKQKTPSDSTCKYNKRRRQWQQHTSDSLRKKRKPIYNHYASGSGWWDSDMEGIDSEEVGFNEVWEGMGSTTIGGLQWH